MTFFNSLKSILRTPFKTILFLILVAAVTTFACLGLGMWESSTRLIKDADSTYTTTAVVEYIDDGYPDAAAYTDLMMEELYDFDYAPFYDNQNVLLFDRQYEIGGYIEGFEYKSKYKYHDGYGVILFRYKGLRELGHSCQAIEPYYTGSTKYIDGTMFYLSFADSYPASIVDSQLKEGHLYIAHGEVLFTSNKTNRFIVAPYENPRAPKEQQSLFNTPIWDVTDIEDFRERERYQVFMSMVLSYNVMNNYVSVYPMSDVTKASPFIQQETHLLDDGASRFFTEEEYRDGSRVVILSEYIAKRMGVSVGDKLKLNLYAASGAMSARSSFWADGTFLDSDDYTVVGIFRDNGNLSTTAYVPKPTGENNWLPEHTVCYHMASVHIKNGSVEAYYTAIEPYLLSNMKVTVFDQGYAEAIAPIDSMRETALLLIAISGICCIVVIFLFTYMYVTKQKETVGIMIALGTGKARATFYLVMCVLLVSILAAVGGATAGYFLSENVTKAAYERAAETTNVDNRFSAVYMNSEKLEMKMDFGSDPLSMAIVAAAVVALSLILSFMLTRSILKNTRPKMLRIGTSVWRRMAFTVTVAMQAITRGGIKNVIVPVTSMLLLIFIGVFGYQIINSETELEELYDNSTVYAYYTTNNGKRVDTLHMYQDDIKPILDTGFVAESYFTSIRYTQPVGVVQRADNRSAPDPGYITIPRGFALDTFIDKISDNPKAIFTRNMKLAPEFFYETDMNVTFLENYDVSILESSENVCIMAIDMMNEYDYALGDVIRFGLFTTHNADFELNYKDLKIVGQYSRASNGLANIYMPYQLSVLRFYVVNYTWGRVHANKPPNPQTDDMEAVVSVEEISMPLDYNAICFKLTELRNMEQFKEYLIESGYSAVGGIGKSRTWLVIEDSLLNSSVMNINRHISYMTILFIVVYGLSIGMGFIISYLLTKSRRSELAMMRSMGAGMVRTFNAFFLEQAILCLIGGAFGIGVLWLIYRSVLAVQWYSFIGYFACYWIGIVISIMAMNRVNVIRILTAKE